MSSNSHFNRLLNSLDTSEELYYVAMMILFAISDNKKYAVMSELITVLDQKNFTRFISCYEGQTLQVPTKEEVTQILNLLNLYFLTEIKGLVWGDALEKLGIEDDKEVSLKLRGHISKLKQVMLQIDIPLSLKNRKKNK